MRILLCLSAVALAGCLVDGDAPCGPSMTYARELGVCVCESNAIAGEGGCDACASDEIVVDNTCACAPGQGKNAENICETLPGLGTACDAANPCTSPEYEHCWERAGEGTCTQTCATDTDCPDTYTCADWESTPYCRTFSGFGATCTTAGDCSAYDADFCIQGRCAIQGCTIGVDDCPRGTECCDFSGYGLGTLCAPAESCP